MVEVTEEIGPESASKLSPSSRNSEGKGDFGARVYLAAGKLHNGLVSWSKPSSTLTSHLTSQKAHHCGITHPGERLGLRSKRGKSISVYETQFHESIQGFGISLQGELLSSI